MSDELGKNLPQALRKLAEFVKEHGRGAIWYHVMDEACKKSESRACFEKEWGLPPLSLINQVEEAATTTDEFNAAADAYREYMASFKVYMTVALGLESRAPIKVQQWIGVYNATGQKRFDEQFGVVEDGRPSAAEAISAIKPTRL